MQPQPHPTQQATSRWTIDIRKKSRAKMATENTLVMTQEKEQRVLGTTL